MSFSCDVRVFEHKPYVLIDDVVRYLQDSAARLSDNKETKTLPSFALYLTASYFQQLQEHEKVRECIKRSFEQD